VVIKLEYEQALEKAVLEYAASLKKRPESERNGRVRIPGYMDNHVWAMAATLGDQGLLVVSTPNGQAGVTISQIEEAGAVRLKEIRAAEEVAAAEDRAKAAEAKALEQKNKKWWKKLFHRNGVSS